MSSGSSALASYQYKYTYSDSGRPRSSGWQNAGNSQSTSRLVSSLTNGTAYSFQVRARNQTLEGAASSSVSATPKAPDVPPTAPRNLVATAGNGRVSLSWEAPLRSGSSVLGFYDFRVDKGNNDTWTDWESTNSKTTALTVSELTNGVVYDFQVRARNQTVVGVGSNTATATPTGTIPTAPRGLRASTGNSRVTLRWSAPSDNGGQSDTSV